MGDRETLLSWVMCKRACELFDLSGLAATRHRNSALSAWSLPARQNFPNRIRRIESSTLRSIDFVAAKTATKPKRLQRSASYLIQNREQKPQRYTEPLVFIWDVERALALLAMKFKPAAQRTDEINFKIQRGI